MADHGNIEASDALHAALLDQGLTKEAQILILWRRGDAKLT